MAEHFALLNQIDFEYLYTGTPSALIDDTSYKTTPQRPNNGSSTCSPWPAPLVSCMMRLLAGLLRPIAFSQLMASSPGS
jgi:hypothetical protein